MGSPDDGLPPSAFWKTAVQDRAPLDPGALYTPRFPVSKSMRVVTAGSCFAQHIGRELRRAGVNVVDAEPLPTVVPDTLAADHGYRLYSVRYGNIYTAAQLAQLYEEACGRLTPQRFLAEGGGAPQGQEHKRGDHAHMNQAFGAEAMAPILTWLSSQPLT